MIEDWLWESWLIFIEKQLILQFKIYNLFYDNSAAKYLWWIKDTLSIFEILFLIGNSDKISKGKKPF